MKCSALLTLALVVSAAADGAWKLNKIYTYKLLARTLKPLQESKNDFDGVISRAYLSIRPQSDVLLIGQITQADFGKVTDIQSGLDNRNLDNTPLKRPFKIHLENGVIRSLSVDDSLTNYEINQLKVIVSQFQVDTNGQNQILSSGNDLTEKVHNTAFFKTMEPLVTGNCETIYEISPIPEYLIQTHPEWVPLSELKGTGEFIQIVKSRNYGNCHETSEYLFELAGRKDLRAKGRKGNHFYITEDRRIILSGSLENYAIQSSVSVSKVLFSHDNSAALTYYVNVTLESVVDRSDRLQTNLDNLMNMRNIGNLVYNHGLTERISSVEVKSPPRLFASMTGNVNAGDKWSHCWTAFPAASTLCKSEYGPEYLDVDTRVCGFLSLGKQALCRLVYPGCVATPCFSAFISRMELCERTFKFEFPLTRGGFEDCAPGFYRSRCCPIRQ